MLNIIDIMVGLWPHLVCLPHQYTTWFAGLYILHNVCYIVGYG